MNRYHRNRKIGAIMCQLVNIDVDNGNKIIDTMIQVRIFRNTKEIYYKDKKLLELSVTEIWEMLLRKDYKVLA